MKKMIKAINNCIFVKNKLFVHNLCLCGISGGQDSVLLFILLLHLKKQWNITINILHFHHFWHQNNFFYSQQVWKLSFVFKNSLYFIPAEKSLKNEKKARVWRQENFERICWIEKSNKMLLGHTASDRLETAFWHLIRGTSPKGLISLKKKTILIIQNCFFTFPVFHISDKKLIHFYTISSESEKYCLKKKLKAGKKKKLKFLKKKTNLCFLGTKKNIDEKLSVSFLSIQGQKKIYITYSFLYFNLFIVKNSIYRPLFFFHRNDITLSSKKYLLPLFYDQSNENFQWSRNRIRQQLFPLIKIFFNLNFEFLLENFLEITSSQQDYIEYLVLKIIFYSVKKKHKFKNQFQLFPESIQNCILEKLFQYSTNIQPTLSQIQEIKRISEKNF